MIKLFSHASYMITNHNCTGDMSSGSHAHKFAEIRGAALCHSLVARGGQVGAGGGCPFLPGHHRNPGCCPRDNL